MTTNTRRPLNKPERIALETLIARGTTDYSTVTNADRARWRKRVPTTEAGAACTCGTCPSIELIPSAETPYPTPAITVVLQAYTEDALLMLFIEHDQFSYLELAPLAPDGNITAFPGPEHIQT